MGIVDLIVAGLATWRVSNMLINEYGPFGAFVAVREATGIEHDSIGTPNVVPANNLLSCVWCLSVWVAPVMILFPKLARVFAVSALAILAEKAVDRGDS